MAVVLARDGFWEGGGGHCPPNLGTCCAHAPATKKAHGRIEIRPTPANDSTRQSSGDRVMALDCWGPVSLWARLW